MPNSVGEEFIGLNSRRLPAADVATMMEEEAKSAKVIQFETIGL